MTFERTWVLLFALLPIAWAWWERRRAMRVPGGLVRLGLKAASLIAVIVALAEPRISTSETKLAVHVLTDRSASMSQPDLDRLSNLTKELAAHAGRHQLRVIPFAGTDKAAGRATDLEAAIREAAAGFPEKMVPRMVLVSDGKENRGSITRAAWQMRELGIPVDVFPMKGRARPELRIENVGLPSQAYAGERFTVVLAVRSPRAARVTVEIAAEGKPVGQSEVALEQGLNEVKAMAAFSEPGAVEISGAVRAQGLGEVRFARAITLRRPKMLYLSQDPEGSEVNLLRAAAAAKFDVKAAGDFPDTPLNDYQLIAINNLDLDALPPARKQQLEDFAKAGGGVLVIAGERNVYIEKKKDTPEDPLERTLPAKLAPPRSPEGTCVVLIVDKSSSMEGRKMDLARQAAIGVIENLRPIDMVGVLIFDNSFQWAVPIRKAEDKLLIKRLVAGITPDGGTQIAPALSEAYRKVVPVKATFKHVVLLTDGISEEGDSIAISREAAQLRITISTVGLGQDVNRAYLEKVASFSKGRAYFLIDPSGLEQILLRDVMEHTGSTAIERPVTPLVTRQAEILEGVGIESAPALKGYVKFASKPAAETILAIDAGAQGQDPLLARWQYGLGRSAVFTSDAKSRWAEAWISWPGFDRFWTNLLRDLLPHSTGSEATPEFDPASGNLVVRYRLGRQTPEPKTIPSIFVLGPDGFQAAIAVEKTGPGLYEGRIATGERRGMFRIRPLEENPAFPETGFYREEEELADWGSNEPLLKQLAEFTGGRVNPRPAEVFQGGGRGVPAVVELWPSLLGVAIVLNLIELFLRKWRGLGRRASTVAA